MPPDKADAVRALRERYGRTAHLFAGDDESDEPLFERAGVHDLTIRVGNEGSAAARHFAARQAAMVALLHALLEGDEGP